LLFVLLELGPLSVTIARQRKTIADLRRQLHMKQRNPAQVAAEFSVDSVQNSSIPDLFKFYTGFTFAIFMTIFSCLVPDENSVYADFKMRSL